MPGILDVFNTDPFSMASLTNSINKLPYAPSMLGKLGIFSPKPITTITPVIEEKYGKLSLVQSAPRGGGGGSTPAISSPERVARPFVIPHLPRYGSVDADDVQGVRAFGSETQTETVASMVNEKLSQMRQDFEATHEYHRVGAVKGIILDADGSTIYNLFTEFGLTQDSVSFDFTAGAQEMKLKAMEIIRLMQSALGGLVFNTPNVLCGDDFFDAISTHANVKDAFYRVNDSRFLREQQAYNGGFEFGGIWWVNYRGSIDTTTFIATDEAYAFPTGVSGLFQHYDAPANYVETVNTMGKLIYAKQERQKFDKGIDIEGQSNVLHFCNRPQCLIKLTDDTP